MLLGDALLFSQTAVQFTALPTLLPRLPAIDSAAPEQNHCFKQLLVLYGCVTKELAPAFNLVGGCQYVLDCK